MPAKRSVIGKTLARARNWLSRRRAGLYKQSAASLQETYSATLPEGFGPRKITITFSLPPLPSRQLFAFSDHAVNEHGEMTKTVLATTTGGFAISHDLGETWKSVQVKGHKRHRFIYLRAIGGGEILAQALPPGVQEKRDAMVDLFVLNEHGDVLVKHPEHSLRWHSCRSVDIRDGTLMYAEYPGNRPVNGRRPHAPRVFRSRDRGRSWQIVFTQTGDQIRHFHFLQQRPGVPREWWLASGDLAHECRIWRSQDDGDTWIDLTASLRERFKVGGAPFNHSIFRLTDLFWIGNEIVWGTDDYLGGARPPGARIFASVIADPLSPREAVLGRRQFRNIIDLGDHLLFVSQRSRQETEDPEDVKPGVYLMPKRAGAPAIHLFNLNSGSTADDAGFTFSKASRAAVDSIFFSFRASHDVFPGGNAILRWKVTLE